MLALLVLLVSVAGLAATPSSPAAHPLACPKLTPAQIRSAVGVKPVSVMSAIGTGGTIATGGGIAINCFYTLGAEPSISLKAYRGTAALATLVKVLSTNLGIFNGTANANNGNAPGCTLAKAGYCQAGGKFDEHLSPLAGLGQKAFDDPGGPADGANVEFIWKGNTFAVRSSGPYGTPGPNLRQVIAFARVVIRSGYTL